MSAGHEIEAGILYDDGEITLSVCLLADGEIAEDALNAGATIYNLDGTMLDTFGVVATPDTQGNFRFPVLEQPLDNPAMYYVVISIDHGTHTDSKIIYPRNL